jgi:hypothetical protein
MRKTKRTKRNFTNRLGPYTNTHPALHRHDTADDWAECLECQYKANQRQRGRRVDR